MGRIAGSTIVVYLVKDVELLVRIDISCSARYDSSEEQCGIGYQVITRSKSPLGDEVMMIEAVVEGKGMSRISVMLANLGNKTVKVPQIVQLGTVLNMKTKRQVKFLEIRSCRNSKALINLNEIRVPLECKELIMNLIQTNKDVVAN